MKTQYVRKAKNGKRKYEEEIGTTRRRIVDGVGRHRGKAAWQKEANPEIDWEIELEKQNPKKFSE